MLKERVRVISARMEPTEGKPVLPASQWKIKLFLQLHEMLELSAEQITNLIIVGDSMNEMNAGQRLSKKLPQCILKMIKM